MCHCILLLRCHVQGKGWVLGGGWVYVGVCAWERGDSEQPCYQGGHSWMLLVFLPCFFLLPMLQELGAV